MSQLQNDILRMKSDWKTEKDGLQREISDRRNNISDLRNEMLNSLDQFKRGRAKSMNDLMANFKKWDGGRAKDLSDFRSGARSFMIGLTNGDKTRMKEVGALKGGVRRFLKEFQDVGIGGFKKENIARNRSMNQFRTDVRNLMKDYQDVREAAASVWKSLSADTGHGPARNTAEKSRPKAAKKNAGKKKTKASVKAKEENNEILAAIKSTANGLTVSEISYLMGTTAAAINPDLKKLLGKGAIRKEGNTYFAD